MKIAVIGAGEMGHGIAELAALRGHDVRMRDIKQEYLDRGMERIRWSLGKLVEKSQIRQAEADAALARITATLDLREACHDADIAIEAVFEDAELKKKVFKELDAAAPEKTILASNTSALPITNMALATKRPKKVVGMHFFNPPMLMPLIEVIRADTTSDATLAAAVELTKSLGKTPIVVRKDIPGFITTRVLGPYFEEAAWIHEQEGIPIETIDAAMRFRAGFPMGPFELADQVGVDVLHHLIVNANRPMPKAVQALVDAKKVGRKVGAGFYAYAEGRPKLRPEMGAPFEPIRILAPMINEAAELVSLDVASPAEIDEAMRLGTAFPRGPLATADDLGIDVVLAALNGHPRSRPAKILGDMVARGDLGAKSGKGFYEHRGGGAVTKYETLLVTTDATSMLATVTLNRPDRLNTLSPLVFDELEQALIELDRQADVRCVVITGAGDRAFSAGADLTSFSDISKAFKVWQFSRRAEEVFSRLANFPKPTIAAINGHCFGGGLELAIACDFRIAAKRAKLGQTEVNIGLVPGAGGSQRLVRILGQPKAKELVFLGSRLSAEEAAAIGLVTKTVENEAFDSEVRSFAEKLAKQAPIAIRLAKTLLNRSGDIPIDAALEMEAMAFGLVASTEDIYEGLQAFMEKREPKFKGE
ncbi:MAG TPA: 3-hydroxyacyl-CoA dehydrogenase NAD-binding domain-containing protein [Thermoplasmata archaeon]|nr:3-hydroxyacyl-CoA dehydrogenase NAD-binding domain-containing protein [Thermoplasmata archaeon]